jgi:hypothetical protein
VAGTRLGRWYRAICGLWWYLAHLKRLGLVQCHAGVCATPAACLCDSFTIDRRASLPASYSNSGATLVGCAFTWAWLMNRNRPSFLEEGWSGGGAEPRSGQREFLASGASYTLTCHTSCSDAPQLPHPSRTRPTDTNTHLCTAPDIQRATSRPTKTRISGPPTP